MIPHVTTEHNVHDGHFIPKGSMLLYHIKHGKLGWCHLTPLPPRFMLRNGRVWDDPAQFKPQRFLNELKEGQGDPESMVFDFERRWLLRLTGFLANSGDRNLPWKGHGKSDCSSIIMILLWALEIIPIEGEARPDPRNPQFVDSVLAYLRLRSPRILLIASLRAPAPSHC